MLSTGRASERLTDGELVTLALNGVEPAFSWLVERHSRHLRMLVARRLRDPQDILDVIQETQLAIWRALHSYDIGRPFEAWLTSIAVNKCRDWARHRCLELSLHARLEEEACSDGQILEERSAESLAAGEESVRDLERALASLPQRLREPLILTALLELSQDAVARELRATRKAVEMRVRRARQRLRQVLSVGLP